MSHFVYILQSLKDQKYYIGETSDVDKRLIFHNNGFQRSTKNRTPFRIILVEKYQNRSESLKREKQIKSWKGGEAFKKLLEGCSPAWAGHTSGGRGVVPIVIGIIPTMWGRPERSGSSRPARHSDSNGELFLFTKQKRKINESFGLHFAKP